jgi:pimeloyl-ACP methyl ester carboxylesterase
MPDRTEHLRLRTPDGRDLDVFVAGPADGQALLFHTGTPTAGIPFGPLVEALAERDLRWVSFSRPGYGSSTRRAGRLVADVVDDARAVLDHLGADHAYVAGWSGGGPHALACAALMAERTRAVATIASVAPFGDAGMDRDAYLAGMGAENIEEFGAALTGPAALVAFMERERPSLQTVTGAEITDAFGDLIDDVDRGALTGAFAEWTAATFREAVRESYWGWYDDDLAFLRPWGFELASIAVPVHLWQGGHDRMVPFAHGLWLAAHLPTATAHLDAGEGHLSLAISSMGRILDELVASGR